MSCVKIIIKEANVPANNVPSHLLDADGFLTLDLDSNFSLRKNKRIEELSDINKIKTDGVLDFSVKSTPKNDFILSQFISINRLSMVSNILDVYVITNSCYLRQSTLYVKGYGGGNYELSLRNGNEHWATTAQTLKLNELKLATNKTYDIDYINAQNQLEAYIDNEDGTRFPLANYGTFQNSYSENFSFTVADFRPWFSLLYMLQKGFCQLGWKFNSPILETDYGRRLIVYAMSKNVIKDDALLASRKFNVKNAASINWINKNNQPIIFNSIIENTGGNYQISNGHYIGAGIFDIKVKLKFQFESKGNSIFNNNPRQNKIITKLFYSSASTGLIEVESQTTEINKGNGFNDTDVFVRVHEFTAKDVQIDVNSSIYVTLSVQDIEDLDSISILNDSNFSGTCTKVLLRPGDVFDVAETLSEEYTLLDLLKGAVHLVNGKLDTDFNTKELTLYPPYKSKIFNNEISDGYFADNIVIDLTNKIQLNSERISTVVPERKRYKIIKFNGKGDSAIAELKLEDSKSYLSQIVDYGAKYGAETETNENPFFEATLNKLIESLTTNGVSIDLPHLLDNTEGRLSFDLKPRIAYWQGSVKQFIKVNGNDYSPEILIEDTPIDLIPYAYQLSNCFAKITNTNLIAHNVVYGITSNKKDLYNFFYKRWLFENDVSMKNDLLVFLHSNEFGLFSLRDKYMIKSLGKIAIGRLTEIRDFDSCVYKSTPVTFVNERQILTCYDNLGDIEDVENLYCNQNMPQIIITNVNNDYIFSLGGVNNSVITTVDYSFKFLDEIIWIEDDHVNLPDRPFEVKMIVYYADCPKLTRTTTRLICQNYPELIINYNENTQTFDVDIIGQINSNMLNVDLQCSLNNEPYNVITVDDNVPASIGTIIKLTAAITYEDGCKISHIEFETVIP